VIWLAVRAYGQRSQPSTELTPVLGSAQRA
jgi:hypothetical protein